MSTATLAPSSSHSNFPVIVRQFVDSRFLENRVDCWSSQLAIDLTCPHIKQQTFDERKAWLAERLAMLMNSAVAPKIDGEVADECDIADKLALTVKFKGDHRNLELTREQVVLDLTHTGVAAGDLEEIRFCPDINGATIVCRPYPETILGRLIVTYECECQL